jgi:hypothetical protein
MANEATSSALTGALQGLALGPVGLIAGAAIGYGRGRKAQRKRKAEKKLLGLQRAEAQRRLQEEDFLTREKFNEEILPAISQQSVERVNVGGSTGAGSIQQEGMRLGRRERDRRLEAIQRQRANLTAGFSLEDVIRRSQESMAQLDQTLQRIQQIGAYVQQSAGAAAGV